MPGISHCETCHIEVSVPSVSARVHQQTQNVIPKSGGSSGYWDG